MDKDYYKIMGLEPTATEQEIKTAYRRLARKYHPDISKETNAEERFKEMGEAYETLKDPKKRAQYDDYLKNQTFYEQAQNTRTDQSSHYYGNETEFHGSPFTNNTNNEFNSDFFESLFGHARAQSNPNKTMAGQDYHGKIDISLEEAFNGTVKEIQLPTDTGKTQNLKVKIPAGIKSGQQIRLSGQGGPGINNGPKGDLYLTIELMQHPLFEVKDNDVYLTLPLTPWEAALGATLVVPTLSGKIDLKIPPGSQGGQKLRIKNRGLPGTHPGHQYVLLKISTPPATTEEAKELYQKMAELMPFNPRASMGV